MKKKQTVVLIIACVLIAGLTFLGGFCGRVSALWLKILLLALCYASMAAVAVIAMKLSDLKENFDVKNAKQYGIGIGIALVLSLFLAFVPALCDFSLVGSHKKFTWFGLVYNFLNYFLIIGPVEEFVFRVYIQGALLSLFEKKKYIGVLSASLLFGLWHWINGAFIQVLFTFGIGAIFGFSKYLIKDCKYPGLAVGHGLYDFLNEIVRYFVV